MKEGIGKKLVSHTMIYGLASLLINGSNFFLIPFYTHHLTTEEYGVISSVTLFSTIATAFLTFGLNGAVTRFFVEYSETEFKEFIFSIFLFQAVTASAICGFVVLSNGIFLDHLFSNVRYNPYLKYGVFTSLFSMFSAIPLAVLQAQTRALLYRIYTTVSFVLLTAFMMYFIVWNEDGGMGGVRAAFYASLLMAILYTIFILRNSQVHFKWTYLKGTLAFSLPIMIYTVFGSLVEISSKFFIEKLISLAELGVYNVAQQISALVLLLTNAINMAWVPIFFSEAKKAPDSKVFEGFGKILVFGLTTAGLVICVFAKEFVSIFMPGSYLQASIYIPYLIFTYVIGSSYWVLMVNPITFAKKTIYLPIISVVAGIATVGANWILVPSMGVIGAALSTLAGYLIRIAVAYFVLRKHSPIKYDFNTMNSIVIAGLVCYILSTQIRITNIGVDIIAKLGMVILYFLLLRALRIYSIKDIRNFIKASSNTL